MQKHTLLPLIFCGLCAVHALAAAADKAPIDGAPCAHGQAHPQAAAELAQFEFLIGDFSIASHIWQVDKWSPPRPGPKARWNGHYGLGGMAIVDEWYDPDPAHDPMAPRGINVRIYDAASSQWKMMWVATGAAQVQDLRAEMRDGVLTMWQVYPTREDFKAEFIVEDADHWHRISYRRDAAGDWAPQYKLAATRLPCTQ